MFGGYAIAPTHATFGNMVLLPETQINVTGSRTLAHELAHFFNIVHTGTGQYLPVNTPFHDTGLNVCSVCDENQVIPTGWDCSGSTIKYGDFICDTPADPGDFFCENYACDESCENTYLSLDGFIFNPDKYNIMSGYHCSPQHFSQGQFDRMFQFLTTHPDYEFLLASADCVDIGKVDKVFANSDGIRQFDPLPNVDIDITEYPTTSMFNEVTNGNGEYEVFHNDLFDGENQDVEVEIIELFGDAADLRNGVTTLDLVKMRQHILNIVPFTIPEQFIAADINYNGSVTTLDLVKLRKVILNIDNEFPQGSWVFVPEYYLSNQFSFHNDYEANPLTAEWVDQYGNNRVYRPINSGDITYFNKYEINKHNTDILNEKNWNFRAIKIGDVNGNATTEEQGEPVFLTIEQEIEGNQAKYNFKVEGFEDIIGYQMIIDFDKVNLEYFQSLERDLSGVIQDFFGATDAENGIIRTLWYDDVAAESKSLMDGEEIFQLVFNGAGDFSSANVQSLAESGGGQRVTDASAIQLKNYAIGKNGEIRPIILRSQAAFSVDIVPNPFQDNMNLDIYSSQAETVEIEIHNVLGQLIYQKEQFLLPGMQRVSINDLAASDEILLVTVKNGSKTITRKVLKSS
ncbi:MAG: hypothetical protein ACI9XO_003068 [Paraglaciecola sp.]|jgi:hypothetical protein